jgi:hypothetical protein
LKACWAGPSDHICLRLLGRARWALGLNGPAHLSPCICLALRAGPLTTLPTINSSPLHFLKYFRFTFFFKIKLVFKDYKSKGTNPTIHLWGLRLKPEFLYSLWTNPSKLTLKKIEPETLRWKNSKDPSQHRPLSQPNVNNVIMSATSRPVTTTFIWSWYFRSSRHLS